jgi:6-phosphogluconolactonase
MMVPASRRMLVGGYTDESSGNMEPHGIVPVRHDRSQGWLRQDGAALEVTSPSYLLAHPHLPLVYAVNESATGAVSAVGIQGALELRTTLTIPGQLPCHLCLAPDLRYLLVANYGSGNVVALRLGSDGIPQEVTGVFDSYGTGPHPRQDGPHAHHILRGPDGAHWVVDLGADVVRRLQIGPDGTLAEGEPVVALPAGTGPRQVKVSADQRTAYVLGEISGELITVALSPGKPGAIVDRRPSSLSEPSGENLPAHLLLSGDRLYVSHRGLDKVTVFSLDNGVPTPMAEIDTGAWPRHFALDGGWLYSADQRDDQLTAQPVPVSGDSLQTPQHLTVRAPTCVLLL